MCIRLIAIASVILGLVWGCASPIANPGVTPIDQVPMYGGMDRQADPRLKEGDRQFIEGTTKAYGSRERASTAAVNNAFIYYNNGDLDKAMRRFNQAWLLNPENPEAYWGFALVLHDKGKNCQAKEMIDRALALHPPEAQGFYPDAGRIYALCAVSDPTHPEENKAQMKEQSELLYRKGEKTEPDKAYLYGSWATAYYWQGKYEDAWKMVDKQRTAGGKPSEQFLSMLRAKMAEPGEKR
jgi:tetratricopeptide (TPR) repeat protein